MKKYDYLVVGAGFFGAVFAHEAQKRGCKCMIVERRNHIGGNAFTDTIKDIHVHQYGAHIFHTANKKIWDYVGMFGSFNHYVNAPIANYKGELYNLPFNMNTFYQLWKVKNARRSSCQNRNTTSKCTKPTNLFKKNTAKKNLSPLTPFFYYKQVYR